MAEEQYQEFREAFFDYLKKELSAHDMNTWIMPLKFRMNEDEKKVDMAVITPNAFSADFIEENFLHYFKVFAMEFFEKEGKYCFIKVEIDPNGKENIQKSTVNAKKISKKPAEKPIIKRPNLTQLNANYTFEKLVRGKSNELAYACAQNIAEAPGKEYNPLFIYGASGLGKTHLMQAIGNEIVKKMPEKKVRYLLVKQYTDKWIQSLKKGTADDFKKEFQNVDVLLIDDVQFFPGKGSTQEEFFYLFNHLRENQKQIILTSDDIPKNLKDLDDRLKTRFSEGLKVLINPPDFEMRVAILNKKAEDMKISLDKESAFYVAQHLYTNVRDLEGALNNIKAYANLMKKKNVDLALTKEALRDTISAIINVQVPDILQAVANCCDVRVNDLISKSRKGNLVRPRHMAMWLCREITHKSFPEIAASFGGRHHTSVLSAINAIQTAMETDDDLKHQLERLKMTITGSSDA